MSAFDDERAVVRAAQNRLDDWLFEARSEAFEECFGGDDPVLSESELAELDRLDSEMSRGTGDGLWGTDEYGIVTSDALDATEPRVVCVYHPEIPGEGYRGTESTAESTREEYNDVLWAYAERVATAMQDRLEAFLEARGATREE